MKHIDWKRVGLVIFIFVYLIGVPFLFHIWTQNLGDDVVNYGDCGRWVLAIALTLLSPFGLLLVLIVLYFISRIPRFIYHNREDKDNE